MGDFVGGLFGSDGDDAPVIDFNPVSISGGGINTSFRNNKVNVSSNSNRKGLFDKLSGQFSSGSSEFDNLLGKVSPGFGNLTNARVQAIRDAARSSIGNLGDTLSRRRVFGSSFGQDAIARAEAEFGKAEADVRARSFLEELDVSTQLIEKKQGAAQKSIQVLIDNLNFEAGIGLQLASGATAALASTATAQAQLQQQSIEENNGILGSLIGFGSSFIPGAGGAAAGAAAGAGGFNASAAMLGISDYRAKENIRKVGKEKGFNIYEFNYKGMMKKYIGVMAQEVERVMSDAVSVVNGIKQVNYEMIGIEMREA